MTAEHLPIMPSRSAIREAYVPTMPSILPGFQVVKTYNVVSILSPSGPVGVDKNVVQTRIRVHERLRESIAHAIKGAGPYTPPREVTVLVPDPSTGPQVIIGVYVRGDFDYLKAILKKPVLDELISGCIAQAFELDAGGIKIVIAHESLPRYETKGDEVYADYDPRDRSNDVTWEITPSKN